MRLLEGKTVLISGSGRGIGAAMVARCAIEGANVVINYLQNREMAEKTLASVKENSGNGIIVQADVRKNEEVHKLVSATGKAFGGLDVLINNAHKPFEPKYFANLTWHDILEQLEGSLASSFYCIQHAMPYLEKSSSGVVLNISSVTVRVPEEGFSHRNIAKAALEGMTRSLAYEYADKGIRFNALSVGWTETDQLKSFSPEYHLRNKSDIPMKRFATAEEIADTALFLISPLSRYVTGTVFPVAGGLWPNLE